MVTEDEGLEAFRKRVSQKMSSPAATGQTAIEATYVVRELWRCPICRSEETLSIESAGRIACRSCGAIWDDLRRDGMTLVSGSAQHLGRKTLEDWAQLASGPFDIQAREDIPVPIILQKGEGVVRVGQATLYGERTRRVPGMRPYAGLSFRVTRGVRLSLGNLLATPDKRITEVVTLDSGEFILTSKRLVFNGGKRPITITYGRILSVEIEGPYLAVSHGQQRRLFGFGSESLGKWLTYVKGMAETAAK